MQAAEKRRQEQEKLKAQRVQHIIETSFHLFAEQGIDSITMNVIAEKAEIGVASLYRYFVTKEDLAIEVATYAWKMEEQTFSASYDNQEYRQLTGFQQLKVLLSLFPEALETQAEFFRFVYYFDSFVKRGNLEQDRLRNYESNISGLKNVVVDAISKGIDDGSIKFRNSSNDLVKNASVVEIYFTVMHSILSMAQKLSLSGKMLFMDSEVEPRRQMELFVNLLLDELGN